MHCQGDFTGSVPALSATPSPHRQEGRFFSLQNGKEAVWLWMGTMEPLSLETAVEKILRGEDPHQIKAAYERQEGEFEAFLARQREVIRNQAGQQLIEAVLVRILAAERVAAAKFLEGQTIHKADVESRLIEWARAYARERYAQLGPIGTKAGAREFEQAAEDLIRATLSKARRFQEMRYNAITAELLRRHKETFDAENDVTEEDDYEVSVQPMSSPEIAQMLARERELVKEFRVADLSRPERRRELLRFFPHPHRFMERGLVIGGRDVAEFMRVMERVGASYCSVICGFSPHRRMHLGHAVMFELLAYFQKLGARVVIPIGDLKASILHATPRRDIQEHTIHFLTHLMALGLDLDAADIYSQWHRREVLSLAMEIGRSMKMGVINSALGVDMASSVSRVFCPLIEVADILHRQRREHGGDRHTLVVHGLDQDVYVRLARQVAERMKFRKPAALYLRFVKGLKQYQDAVTGGLVDKMSSGSPNSALYYDDPPEDVRRKVRRAVTGGDQGIGGNPDPRVCAVSSLMAFFTVAETAEYEAICCECREHRLRCMDCKARCAEALVAQVAQHQARIEQEGFREQARARVKALGI